MDVTGRGRSALVSNDCPDRNVAVTEICTQRCEGVAQHIRRHVNGELAELQDLVPQFSEAFHGPIAIDVVGGNSGHLQSAQKRLDVAFDAPPIDFQRRRLLRHFTPREQPSGLRIGEVEIAQLRHGGCLTLCPLGGGGVFAFLDLPEQALRLGSSRLRGPGRTVSSDGLPALSAFQSPVDQNVGSDRAPLAPHAEAGDSSVPNGLARL